MPPALRLYVLPLTGSFCGAIVRPLSTFLFCFSAEIFDCYQRLINFGSLSIMWIVRVTIWRTMDPIINTFRQINSLLAENKTLQAHFDNKANKTKSDQTSLTGIRFYTAIRLYKSRTIASLYANYADCLQTIQASHLLTDSLRDGVESAKEKT